MIPPQPTDEAQIVRLQRLIAHMRERVNFVEGSRFWKLRELWLVAKKRLGFRHDPAIPAIPPREFVEAMAGSDPYCRWLLEHDPRPTDLDHMHEIARLLLYQPRFAIILDDVGCCSDLAVAAIRAQAYPHARMIHTSGDHETTEIAERWNAGLAQANEDFVVFCTASEILSPDALFEVVVALNQLPEADIVYGDRDTLEGGQRSSPRFTPDWSPETFLSFMYTGQVLFYRRSAVINVGGFRPGFGTASRYDLALRVTEGAKAIAHSPRLLYHEVRDGVSVSPEQTARAVSDAVDRRGESGQVEPVLGLLGAQIVRYTVSHESLVEIIVPTRDHAEDLERCLASVFGLSTYPNLRVTVVDNGSVESETHQLLELYSRRCGNRFRTVRVDEPFNFSRLTNMGVRSTDGEYVLLLNNDTEVLVDDWIEAMVEQAQRPPIGAVGARLLYADGTLQHAGVVVGLGGLAGHVHRLDPEDQGLDDELRIIRNYSAVTAACLMVRRAVFEEVQGFDEKLAIEFNDVDFCLRLLRAGYRNVSLPHVRLYHAESKSRGIPDTRTKRAHRLGERSYFQERWQTIDYKDPYYSENLTSFMADLSVSTSAEAT